MHGNELSPSGSSRKDDDERRRSQPPPDPAADLRGGGQQDARWVAARLEPHRASDATGGRAERPAGAHRRRRLRQSRARSAARSRRRTTRASPKAGVRYNRFHVTALCSPTRAALLTGRNNHAVGFGSVGEFAGGFPGYSATLPRDCAPLPRILRDNGYSTAAFGKWHLTPDGQQGPAGPVRPVAQRLGLRLLLRVPRRRLEPVGSVPGREPEDHRHPGRVLRRRQSVLLPGRDGRPHHRVAARRPRPGRAQAVLRVLLDRMQPRSAPRREGLGRQVQGEVRPGMGQAPRGDLRPPEGARRHPGRRRADAARRGLPGVGRPLRQAEGLLRAPDGGVRRLLGERRPQRRSRDRRDRGAGRARQHADHVDLG